MNQGAKVLLGVLALGGIGALVFASEKQAKAAPGGGPLILPPIIPPKPGAPSVPPHDGVVVVPPIGPDHPDTNSPAPSVVPIPPIGGTTLPTLPTLPNLPTIPGVVPGAPMTTTITLPGIGTFNPATGHVFNAGGIDIGTFDPTTGKFTPKGGQPTDVLPPLPPVPTQVLPGLTITPGPTPSPGEPPASAAEQPGVIAPDTLQVLTTMLAQEHSPHWRISPEPALKPWQQSRKLVVDGLFGPKTALKMAAETGVLPIIRAWPKGTAIQSPDLRNYQAELRRLATSASEPRRSQLLAAAQREQGQGYGTPEKPISTLITLQDG